MLNGLIENGWVAANRSAMYARNIPSLQGRELCHFLVELDQEEDEAQAPYKKILDLANYSLTGVAIVFALLWTVVGMDSASRPLTSAISEGILIYGMTVVVGLFFAHYYCNNEHKQRLKALETRLESKISLMNIAFRLSPTVNKTKELKQHRKASKFFNLELDLLKSINSLSAGETKMYMVKPANIRKTKKYVRSSSGLGYHQKITFAESRFNSEIYKGPRSALELPIAKES